MSWGSSSRGNGRSGGTSSKHRASRSIDDIQAGLEIGMRRALAAAVAAAFFLAVPAKAQEWPQRQVSVGGPFAAGVSTDLIARIIAQHMQATFGVPFVVENKAGAGGSIGTGMVAKAPNDGYTLLAGTGRSHALNAVLYSKPSFA